MTICPHCGFRFEGEAPFCPNCGQAVEVAADTEPVMRVAPSPPPPPAERRTPATGWAGRPWRAFRRWPVAAKVGVAGAVVLVLLVLLGVSIVSQRGTAPTEEVQAPLPAAGRAETVTASPSPSPTTAATTTATAPPTASPAPTASPSPSPQPTATATVTSAPTPVPTATPTPVPPPPAATPPPPPPPAPPSQAQLAAAYAARVQDITQRYGRQLTTIGELAASPTQLSSTWQREWASAWGAVRELNAEVRTLNAPPCLADAQAALLAGAERFDVAATDATAGAQAADTTRLSAALQALSDGTERIDQAARLMSQVAARCGS